MVFFIIDRKEGTNIERKTIASKYGHLFLDVLQYRNNNRIAILSYFANDNDLSDYEFDDNDLFADITVNLDLPINNYDEGFINADINYKELGIVDLLKKEGIIEKSFGKKQYNMGSYEYVKFNLEKLKEYDCAGVENFLESINIGNDELDYKIKI